MVASRLQLARTFPSGEKATARTEPLCPLSVRGSGSAPRSGTAMSIVSISAADARARFMMARSGVEGTRSPCPRTLTRLDRRGLVLPPEELPQIRNAANDGPGDGPGPGE